MGYSEHYKKEQKKMNLGKKYKQLFEGKTRSNDATLIKENANPKVQAVYDSIYNYSDEDSLEILNQYIDDAGLEKEYDKYLDGTKLSSTEENALITTMQDALGEFE